MTRLRVLWVTEELPDRDGGGGSIRQANLLLGLAEHADVCLVVAAPLADEAVRAAVAEVVEVVVPGEVRWRVPDRVRAAWNLFVRRRGLSVAGSAGAARALQPELRARAHGQDVIVVNHENLLPLLPVVASSGALLVAHLFDVKSVVGEQRAAVAPTRRQATMWAADARAMRRLEVTALAQVDVVVTCSPEDEASLARLPQRALRATTVVAPNGVDLRRFTPTEPPGRGSVLFFGSLDYGPNVDGVTWFAREVWPAIRASAPTATLSIVGRRPVPEVLALAALAGVEVEADVPEAAPWFRAADVVVVPLRVGTGTRLKALEAMAAARPIVGTRIGLEGLGIDGATEGAPALLTDDGPALAAGVLAILEDPALGRAMGATGRRHVEERFGWGPIATALASDLEAARLRARVEP